MVETASPDPNFEKLRALCGIAPGEKLTEPEFTSRVHGRGLSLEQREYLRRGLQARGLFEPLA